MRRAEAVVLLAVAIALTVAGLTWLLGPLGLLGSGIGLALVTLFAFDIREESHAEPMVDPARTLVRR